MRNQSTWIVIGLLVFLFVLSSANQDEQDRSCDRRGKVGQDYEVNCENRSLTQPPDDLPHSIFILKLSDNHELEVPRLFFKKRTVYTLQIANCSLEGPFVLPLNLYHLDLSYNALNEEDIGDMLVNPQPQLLSLKLSYNRIKVYDDLNFLRNSPNLLEFDMTKNIWPHLTQEHMTYLKNLHTFRATNVTMRTISPGTFDGMRNLRELVLNYNKIKTIPDGIFKDCNKLVSLHVFNNTLTDIPDLTGLPGYMNRFNLGQNEINSLVKLTEYGPKNFALLYMHDNNIQFIPKGFFKQVKVSALLDLSKNEIKTLNADTFEGISYIGYLFLQRNKVVNVSVDAFRGFKNVTGGMFLFMNKIRHLPRGLFKNTSMTKVSLHTNDIVENDGAFVGVTTIPEVFIVYHNTFKNISKTFVDGLTPEVHFIMSCNEMDRVKLENLKGVKMYCSPWRSYTLQRLTLTTATSLEYAGFNCSKVGQNAHTCIPCPTGTYNNGTHVCIKCPRGGFYQGNVGQIGCERCAIGQFANVTGAGNSDYCQTCPVGTNTTSHAGTRACYCLEGFSRTNRFDRCQICHGYGITCDRDFEELLPDHWWMFQTLDRRRRYTCFADGLALYDDSYHKNCTQYFEEKPKAYKCPIKKACLSGVRGACLVNYTGVLCYACAKHYYRHLKNCVRCPNLKGAVAKVVVVFVLFILFCILIEWADRKTSSSDNRRTLADVILSSSKIVLGFYQTLSVTLTILSEVPWPSGLIQVSYYLKYFEMRILSIGSLRCVFTDINIPLTQELIITLGTFVGVPLALLLFLGLCLHCIPKRWGNYQKRSNKLRKTIFRYIAIFVYATYQRTSERVFQMLPSGCMTLCYDKNMTKCVQFYRADVRVKCAPSEPENWFFVYLAYVGLLVPLGFPFLMLLLVWIYRRTPEPEREEEVEIEDPPNQIYELVDDNVDGIREEEVETENKPDRPVDVPIEFAIRFYYENFKPSAWYWELIDMFRRISMVIAVALFGMETRTNLGVFISLSGFFAITYAYKKPIKDSREHVLQMMSLTVIFLNSCAGVLFKVAPDDQDNFDLNADDKSLKFIIVFLNVSIILVIAFKVIKGLIKALIKCIRERSCKVTRCLDFVKPFSAFSRLSNVSHRKIMSLAREAPVPTHQ